MGILTPSWDRERASLLRALAAALSLSVGLSCQPKREFTSLELRGGVTLAKPGYQMVLAGGDTLAGTWGHVGRGSWIAPMGSHLRGEMLVEKAADTELRLQFRVRNEGQHPVILTAVKPLVVSEETGGFFDFSTGEAAQWLGPENPRPTVLEPGTGLSSQGAEILAFQPISRVLCRLRWEEPGDAVFVVRRQSRTKRRYDLAVSPRLVEGAVALLPDSRWEARLVFRVWNGREAEDQWHRFTRHEQPRP
ncbi:MAG: hypothetical protein ONB23_09745 [candidate division KSB1 bacterium]|nr:hypothetical protein [candidate division KSB1 bacterium]